MVKYVYSIHIMFLLLLFVSYASAEDKEIGAIIEASQNKEFIQVNDHIFKVNSTIAIDDGSGERTKNHRQSLNEGDIVQIVIGKIKTVDYWMADELILYKGEKREQILQGMEKNITVSQEKNITAPAQKQMQQSNPSIIKFEDGIYHNK